MKIKSLGDVFAATLTAMRRGIDKNGHCRLRSNYICDNIWDIYIKADTQEGKELCEQARALIRERIGCRFSVGYWLVDNSPEARDFFNTVGGWNAAWEQQVNLYRLRWLESLVEEFK